MGPTLEGKKEPSLDRVSFSLDVYSIDSIKKAAYRFSDVVSADISIENNEVVCDLSFIGEPKNSDASEITHQFKIEVLDQSLRESIREETEGTRNAILGYAFSKSGLLEDE